MEEYLIDTNVVSDFFSESFTPAGMTLVAEAIDSFPNISVISQIELLCWKTDAGTEQIIKNFIADCNVLEISPFVIEACVRLRRVKKIKTPDAIIAATALAHGFTIITNNEKDFFNIKGLKWINPYKL